MTTFRGAGAWGPGKGAKLTAAEIDANFYGIIQRLSALEGGTPNLNAIDTITFNGSSITILTERGEVFGPWTLPLAVMRARGAWAAGVAYAVLDMVNVPGDGLYLVNVAHTSATSFDPLRRIGTNDVYTQIMTPGAQGPKGDTGDTGPTGATGAQGIQGDKGDTGDTGPTGATGATGAQGIQGVKGDPGTNFSPDAIGTFAGRSAHDSAAQWFSYLSTNGDGASITSAVIFFKNSATAGDWSSATPFQGPKGDTGDTGPQGPTGDTGPQGPAGTNGSGVPAGGATGQVLAKNSATDGDVSWVNQSAGGSGHRFWRLFFTASVSASYCSLSEVEFLDNIDGSDMTGAGTPLSGPTYFGNGGAPAFDDNTSTRFAAAADGVTDGTAWVGYAFSEPVEVRAFTIRGADGFSAEAPTAFKLQYSNTGADGSWIDAQVYTTASVWGNLERRSFVVTKYQLPIKAIKDVDLSAGVTEGQALVYDTASGKFKPGTVASSGGSGSGTETGAEPHRAHRGWRVFAINTIESPSYAGGGFFSVAGLKFFDRTGAQIATSGGDVHGFNMHSSYPASNAFDADASSLASSDLVLADGHRSAVGYIFATEVDVGSVKLTAGTAYQSHMPRDFVVQYSDDLGATWETYGIFSDTATWAASEERTYTLATAGIKIIGGGSGGGDSSITKPLIGNFTLTSEGISEGAVMETSAGGLRLRDPNSPTGNTNVLRYAYQGLPGSNWKVVAKIRRSAWIMFASWGIVMANSTTGNAVLYGTKYDGSNIGRILFNAYNSYNDRVDITGDGSMPEVWLGVSYSGGILVYSFGLAGDRLEDIASESTPWLTGIDRLGFGFNTNHSGRDWYRGSVELLSWKSVAI